MYVIFEAFILLQQLKTDTAAKYPVKAAETTDEAAKNVTAVSDPAYKSAFTLSVQLKVLIR